MPLSHLSAEQLSIVSHVSSTQGLTLVSACAGSGKTTLLKAIADSVPHTHSLYIAYNNSLSVEAKRKFPSTVDCRTTHSLAFQATVKPFNLKVGHFNYKSITERMAYERKTEFIELFREFCLSTHIDFAAFMDGRSSDTQFRSMGYKYLDQMASGLIECTHDFYLKLYHILLAKGEIVYQPFDFILFDEIQDMAPVSSCIFELLPAIRKIGVGDRYQAIYSFNHTVNYFEICPPATPIFSMSQSFRVSDTIATQIDLFAKKYLSSTMVFTGIPYTNQRIITSAYITRTNSALIARMVELNEISVSYKLLRSPDEIFKLPLILCNLKHRSFISNPEYRHLQEHVDDWYEDPHLKSDYKSPIAYISKLYPFDLQLQQACKLYFRYGPAIIFRTYQAAKSHVGCKSHLTLCTAHSSKG